MCMERLEQGAKRPNAVARVHREGNEMLEKKKEKLTACLEQQESRFLCLQELKKNEIEERMAKTRQTLRTRDGSSELYTERTSATTVIDFPQKD